MSKNIIFAFVIGLFMTWNAGAALIQIDISPLAGAALNTNNYAFGDFATGLAATNAVGQPASTATGDEIGAGIFFDDVTKQLTYNIGYGSDYGFVDLVGDFSVAHAHGPVAVQFPSGNAGAGVAFGLIHTAGSSARTGSFSGTTILSATQESQLLDNLLYLNVHSGFAGGGEIRGQLVPVIPEPSSIMLIGVAGGVMVFVRRRLKK